MNWFALAPATIVLLLTFTAWVKCPLQARLVSLLALVCFEIVVMERFWNTSSSADFGLIISSAVLFVIALLLTIAANRSHPKSTA